MKVLPTCGKSTVECQSFMVLDILVAISSSSTAEGSNHRDLNPPLIIGGPTFISPSVSLSIFRLRVKSYQVLKWTLRIHRHIYSLETVLAGRKTREKLVRCSTLFCGKVAALFIIKVDRGSVF